VCALNLEHPQVKHSLEWPQLMRFGAPASYTYKGNATHADDLAYVYLVHFKNDLLLLTMKIDKATDRFSDFDFESP
jgi:hypothetical protein